MKNLLNTISLLLLTTHLLQAQVVMADLDINNVRATILTHGDMFWNPVTGDAGYEFPKGSTHHSNFCSTIWIAGYDTANALHVSAQTYRQSGNDYWPGPLDNAGNLSAASSNDWDKIWKINQTTIDSFISTTPHTVANTPASILEWPAKGNIYAKGKGGVSLSITKSMAPFTDINLDGIYNPLDGDYPKINGEQALWRVFSDNGPTHDETNGLPLKIEIQSMAYACNSIPSLQNTTFYSYTITNFDSNVYTKTRIGIWNDFDLGYAFDDYVGTDTIRRMGVAYNGLNSDPVYGTQLTQTGTVILRSPLDGGTNKQPLGSFMYYNNTLGMPTGNPALPNDFVNYLNSSWIDGQHLTNACDGRDSGSNVNYLFPEDPAVIGGWSERQCNNVPNDRRFIMSTSDFNLPSQDPVYFTIAVINTTTGSSNANFNALNALADSAMIYEKGCNHAISPAAIKSTLLENQISLFPSPVSTELTIKWSEGIAVHLKSIALINSLGETIYRSNTAGLNQVKINTGAFASGNYFVQIKTDQQTISKRFVKE